MTVGTVGRTPMVRGAIVRRPVDPGGGVATAGSGCRVPYSFVVGGSDFMVLTAPIVPLCLPYRYEWWYRR